MKNSEDVKLLENKVTLISRGKVGNEEKIEKNYENFVHSAYSFLLNCSFKYLFFFRWDISTSGSPKSIILVKLLLKFLLSRWIDLHSISFKKNQRFTKQILLHSSK